MSVIKTKLVNEEKNRGNIKNILLVEEGGITNKEMMIHLIENIEYIQSGMLCEQEGIELFRAPTQITYTIDNYKLIEENGKYKIYVDLYLVHTSERGRDSNLDEYSQLLGYYNHYGFDVKLDVKCSFEGSGDTIRYLDIDSVHIDDAKIYNKCVVYERKQKIKKVLDEE